MNGIQGTPHVVFTGGGTGGHLFPGLAVAEYLSRRLPGLRVTFAGTGKEFERRHVAGAGFGYLALPCRPLPRRLRDVFAFLRDYVAGGRAAMRFVRREGADLVVGLGGYASVPMARAAARQSVPLVLFEQNAVPGRATRWLANSADCVCLAMDQARTRLPQGTPILVTGNPLRVGFSRYLVTAGRQESQGRTLVVLGGSGGALALNEAAPHALRKARRSLKGWQIVHQTGEADLESVRTQYHELDILAEVVPFVGDMPDLLGQANLAVCRAGGTTLAELAAMRVPAIVVPYPHAADNHQRANADVFTAAGGCLMLDQRELPGRLEDHLADVLRSLLEESDARSSMATAMGRLARPSATEDVAAVLVALLRSLRDAAAGCHLSRAA